MLVSTVYVSRTYCTSVSEPPGTDSPQSFNNRATLASVGYVHTVAAARMEGTGVM